MDHRQAGRSLVVRTRETQGVCLGVVLLASGCLLGREGPGAVHDAQASRSDSTMVGDLEQQEATASAIANHWAAPLLGPPDAVRSHGPQGCLRA